jgi:beta-glucosidase
MERVGSLDDDRPFQEIADDRPEHRALIRKAGAEGTVLLKNSKGLLPLSAETAGKIAVIGPNAKVAQIMGGGSAQLNPHYVVSPYQGLVNRIGEQSLSFAQGCSNYRFEPLFSAELKAEFFDNREFAGEAVHTEAMDQAQAFWIPPFGGEKVQPGNFSARITGQYVAEESGTHNLGFHCAGLARIYVDGELVLDLTDSWIKGRTFFEEGCDEQTVAIEMAAGQSYELRIDFISKKSDNLTLSAWRLGISRPLGDADIDAAVAAAQAADTAIVFAGRSGEWDTEGSDLLDITLPGRQDELITKVLAANPNTVVVLQTGGPTEMPWVEQADTLLQAWYPGQECGNAIADVLFGDVEPTGRLPQSFPVKWSDNPTAVGDDLVYPGKEGRVEYREKLNIGYRHYDATGIKTLFPFGYGLGYTEFALSNLKAESNADGSVSASVKVTNTGANRGTTVVQLYTSELNSKVERPVKELKQFNKLTLQAGESAVVEFELGLRDFAYCDVDAKGWRVDAGNFRLSAGFNAEQIDQTCDVELTDQFASY